MLEFCDSDDVINRKFLNQEILSLAKSKLNGIIC